MRSRRIGNRRALFTRRNKRGGGLRKGFLAALAAAALAGSGQQVTAQSMQAEVNALAKDPEVINAPALGNALDEATGSRKMNVVESNILAFVETYENIDARVAGGLSGWFFETADRIEKDGLGSIWASLGSVKIPDVAFPYMSVEPVTPAATPSSPKQPAVDSNGNPLNPDGRYNIFTTAAMDEDDTENFAFRQGETITYIKSLFKRIYNDDTGTPSDVWGHVVQDNSELQFFYQADQISLTPFGKGGRVSRVSRVSRKQRRKTLRRK